MSLTLTDPMNRLEAEHPRVAADPPPASNGDGAVVVEPVPELVPEPVAAAEPAPHAEAETPLQAIGQVVFQVGLGVVVLVVAGLMTWYLVEQKTKPATLPPARSAPSVLVHTVKNQSRPTRITGYGNVRAARRINLSPQVGGRVVEINPQLVAGGTLAAGATVLKIDPTDYDLAVQLAQTGVRRAEASLSRVDAKRRAAQSQVAQAETLLQTARAEAEVSKAEFQRINPGEDVPPLVGKEPQVRQAEAGEGAARAMIADVDAEEQELEASKSQAEAELRQATVNRGRTEVKLPNEGGPWRVNTETVDVGQTVAAGQNFADVYDASSLEVVVPLEDRQLQYLDFAGGDDEQLRAAGIGENPTTKPGAAVADVDTGAGSAATITAEFAGADRSWPARVTRAQGQIDPRTRLVEVVVSATDATSSDGAARLVPGLFADVAIDGKPVKDAALIPRRALHASETDGESDGEAARQVVYVAENGRLAVVGVEVVRRSGEAAFVRGLPDGTRVIVTRLDVVAPGMELQAADDEPATQPATRPEKGGNQ